MKKSSKCLLFIFLLFWCYLPISGGNVVNYTIENGLSQNQVHCFCQDRNGFLWIGTNDGLDRFDGHKFVNYSSQLSQIHAGNIIFNMLSDGDSLWVGTNDGVVVADLKTEKFSKFASRTYTGVLHAMVSDILKDREGNYWFATYTDGLLKFDRRLKELIRAPHLEQVQRINGIMQARDGNIWVATVDNGAYCINPGNGMVYNPLASVTTQVRGVTTFFQDKRGDVWIASYTGWLYRYIPATKQIITVMSTEDLGSIDRIIDADGGYLYFATRFGLYLYDIATGGKQRIGISSDTFTDDISMNTVFRDCEKNLWLGTLANGALLLPRNFDNIQSLKGSNYPFSSKPISAIDVDDDGVLWVGTRDDGLFRVSADRKSCRRVELNVQAQSNVNVLALAHYRDKLLCTVLDKGLVIIDRKNTSSQMLVQKGLANREATSILMEGDEKVWIGTSWGMNLCDLRTHALQSIEALQHLHISGIAREGDHILWVGTMNKGLVRYDCLTGKATFYACGDDATSQPFNSNIYSIYFKKGVGLYVGTNGEGLFLLNTGNNKFTRISCDTWPSKVVNSVLESRGKVWVTTNNGLVKLDGPQEGCKLYYKSDGFCSNQFSINSGYVTPDGTIYVGSVSGLNYFNPNHITHNATPPALAFTNLYIYNQVVKPDSAGSPLTQTINYTRRLVLPSSKNIFEIEFAAVTFVNPDKVRYRYMLQGYDTGWVDVKDVPRAVYTSLPAGDYTFKVIACNSDGVWNEKGIELSLTILPPLLLSTPFILLYVLLSLAVAALIVYLYVRRINRRHTDEMRAMTEVKNRELYESKISFFTTIIHEIRTPLTLIIVPLKEILSKGGDIKNNLDLLKTIDRNSNRILALVNQLMDFRKIDSGGFVRQNEVIDVRPVVERTVNQYLTTAGCKHISVTLTLPSEPCFINMDSECMTKIINNLMSNAIKFTKDHITVRLSLLPDKRQLYLEVADNGVGMEEYDVKKILEPFYQAKNRTREDNMGTGIGLSIVNDLVALYDGTINIHSLPREGTTFELHFPLQERLQAACVEESVPNVEQQPQTVPTKYAKGRITLLLVEDNAELRLFLRERLLARFDVLEAADGEEAWQILEEKEVDLVVSDIMMPRMDGNELCLKIKSQLLTCHIPVVLLTAKVEINDKVQGYKNGADLYIEKPFSIELLEVQIESILLNREKQRKKFESSPLEPIETIADSDLDNEFLTKITALIEENMGNPDLSVDMLTKNLYMSRTNVFRKVKDVTGHTPNDFIRIIRLKAAAKMFSQGNTYINDVCYKVGFSTPSYFTKCFQAQFGTLPSEFIKNLRGHR